MKTKTVGMLGMAVVMLVTGCETPYGTPDRTATGALTGGAIGAASGALLGGRHSGEGALIGGAIGALTGGLIGHSMDEEARYRQPRPVAYVATPPQAQPVSLAEVKAMTRSGLGSDVIIGQIRNSHTVFQLSGGDIIDLKNAGVSEQVIQYMINSPSLINPTAAGQEATSVVTVAPPSAPVETVLVSPGPEYVWTEGEWVWNGRWIWVAGHWGIPPRPHAVWVAGYWTRGPHGYIRVAGHWR